MIIRWWKMRSGDAIRNFWMPDLFGAVSDCVCCFYPLSLGKTRSIRLGTRSCYDVWVQSDIYFDRFNASIRIGSPKLLPCGSCPGSFVLEQYSWSLHIYISSILLYIIYAIEYHTLEYWWGQVKLERWHCSIPTPHFLILSEALR